MVLVVLIYHQMEQNYGQVSLSKTTFRYYNMNYVCTILWVAGLSWELLGMHGLNMNSNVC